MSLAFCEGLVSPVDLRLVCISGASGADTELANPGVLGGNSISSSPLPLAAGTVVEFEIVA